MLAIMPIAADLSEWLLLGHLLAAMVWIGGIAVLGVLAHLTVRDPEPGAVLRLTRILRRVGPLVLAPAPVLLVGFALWLVGHDAAWSFDQTWIQLAIGLFVLAFGFGAAHQSQAAIAAQRAAERGDEDVARRALRRWAWGTWLILALLVVVTWDMVAKPGLA